MKKRYKLEYDWHAPMVVEIDDEVLTPEILKDWNEFWSGAQERSAAKNGPLFPLLKMMYLVAMKNSVTSWNALASLRKGEEEGFPKMDGSEGITIISFEEFEFDEDDVEIEEVA